MNKANEILKAARLKRDMENELGEIIDERFGLSFCIHTHYLGSFSDVIKASVFGKPGDSADYIVTINDEGITKDGDMPDEIFEVLRDFFIGGEE